MKIDKETIKNYLPHRDPFLFVDGIDNLEEGKKIQARLELKKELPFFKGHFPQEAIMPGVLIVEALAQTSGLIVALSKISDGGIFYLASNNIKFLEVVRPECTLEMRSTLDKAFGGLFQFSVEALVNGKTAARGTLVLAAPKK